MQTKSLYLTDFRIARPQYLLDQRESFAWMADAHAAAESHLVYARNGEGGEAGKDGGTPFDEAAYRARMTRYIARVGCSPDKIAHRGTVLRDFTHRQWSEMDIYDVRRHAEGAGFSRRMAVYQKTVEGVFDRYFAEDTEAPSDLIHVTCTGYRSPSAAQATVDKKGWTDKTRVTHAYHMGCYAAFPALRIASGFGHLPSQLSAAPDPSRAVTQIVHTELCTLHCNPSDHGVDQLVVQSLFADGFVRYAVVGDEAPARPKGLEILALREEIVPGTSGSMSWVCSDWGLQMTLSKDVPEQIAGALGAFLRSLFRQAGLDFDSERRSLVVAVHPGGPKIIDRVQTLLELDDAQVAASRRVLHDYGNMSSATLPHIWADIVRSGDVPHGTLVASLAFGPGLTVCGGLFRKE